jgi:hypothetical protein
MSWTGSAWGSRWLGGWCRVLYNRKIHQLETMDRYLFSTYTGGVENELLRFRDGLSSSSTNIPSEESELKE